MKIYVSFGQDHRHEINGKVFDKDCIAIIEAPNYNAGRKRAFDLFDSKFCWIYTKEDIDLQRSYYFPRGIIPVEGD